MVEGGFAELPGPDLLLLVRLFPSIAIVPAIVLSEISRFLPLYLQFITGTKSLGFIFALPLRFIDVFSFILVHGLGLEVAVRVSEIEGQSRVLL